jgi:cell division septation protein DedD
MKRVSGFGLFAALLSALLVTGNLAATSRAQVDVIEISMTPPSPVLIQSNGTQRVDFVARNVTLDELTGMSVSASEGDCAGVACPIISERGVSQFEDFGQSIRVPITISMPTLPLDYRVTRTFFFTVTARGIIEASLGTGPIPLLAPNGPDQRPLVRTVTRNFTLVVNGEGPMSPTVTPPPNPPTVTPTTPSPPTVTPPPSPPTVTPTAPVGSPTETPVPTVTSAALSRRFFLPISSRLEGPEVEPNNDRSTAQLIHPGTIIRGRLNDTYDVFRFTLSTTSTISAELSGIPDVLSQRVQFRLDSLSGLASAVVQDVDVAVVERTAASAATINLDRTLGPGAYILYVFTDPSFLSPNTTYQLRMTAR